MIFNKKRKSVKMVGISVIYIQIKRFHRRIFVKSNKNQRYEKNFVFHRGFIDALSRRFMHSKRKQQYKRSKRNNNGKNNHFKRTDIGIRENRFR